MAPGYQHKATVDLIADYFKENSGDFVSAITAYEVQDDAFFEAIEQYTDQMPKKIYKEKYHIDKTPDVKLKLSEKAYNTLTTLNSIYLNYIDKKKKGITKETKKEYLYIILQNPDTIEKVIRAVFETGSLKKIHKTFDNKIESLKTSGKKRPRRRSLPKWWKQKPQKKRLKIDVTRTDIELKETKRL